MRIFGIDFSSAPSFGHPIFVVVGEFDDHELVLTHSKSFATLDKFASFLKDESDYVAGIDFPFGQPKDFVAALGLDPNWESYTRAVCSWTEEDFQRRTKEFRDSQPNGKKHLTRKIDSVADSISPMMWVGVPLAKMFYRGIGILREKGLELIPNSLEPRLALEHTRRIVEAYPALVARKAIERTPYKNNEKRSKAGSRKTHARVSWII